MAFDDEGGIWQLRRDPISGIVEKVRVPEEIEPEPEEVKPVERKKRGRKALNTAFISEDELGLLEDLE